MALQELHSNGKVQWPGDARIAVFFQDRISFNT